MAVAPAEAFRAGIRACRKDKWREGLELLTQVAQQAERRGNLPGMFYGYLGLAMARVEGRKREGLELCRYGVQLQPTEADNYVNLAAAYLILGRRRGALRAVEQARVLSPRHRRLAEVEKLLGVRRPAVFGFLARSNPLNILAGKLRHWIQERKAAAAERKADKARYGA